MRGDPVTRSASPCRGGILGPRRRPLTTSASSPAPENVPANVLRARGRVGIGQHKVDGYSEIPIAFAFTVSPGVWEPARQSRPRGLGICVGLHWVANVWNPAQEARADHIVFPRELCAPGGVSSGVVSCGRGGTSIFYHSSNGGEPCHVVNPIL